MALEGRLKEFPLADIFQLIAQQNKSGQLLVSLGEKEIQVIFESGQVIFGGFRKGDSRFQLSELLLKGRVIEKDKLDKAIELQKEQKKSLGDVLLRNQILPLDKLAEMIDVQTQEVLFQLFLLPDGAYRFNTGRMNFAKNLFRPRSIEGTLMDCFRMIDEWPKVVQSISSIDDIYTPSISFDMDDLDEPSDDLEPNEKVIFELMDGNTTVFEAGLISRMGTFESAKVCASLIKKGRIGKLAPSEIASLDPEVETSEELKTWLGKRKAFLLVLFLLSASIPFARHKVPAIAQLHGSIPSGSVHHLRPYRSIPLAKGNRVNEEKALRFLLDKYFIKNGHYPDTLADLFLKNLDPSWSYSHTDRSVDLIYMGDNE